MSEGLKKKNLILFTLEYPYGKGEAFLEEEIFIASDYYSEIYIVPNLMGGECRKIPNNATVLDGISKYDAIKGAFIQKFLSAYFEDIFLESNAIKKIKPIKVYYAYFKDQIRRYFAIKKIIENINGNMDEFIFYDFWMINNGLALSFLSQEKDISIYSNTHSYDLYDERWGCPLPFRSLIIKSLEKIFPDSGFGLRYLKSKINPELHSKVELGYMGTRDFGMAPFPEPGSITIVSCSVCAEHKRVSRIIEALALLDDEKVEWVHFGDGPLFEETKALAAEKLKRPKCDFKGMVSSEELNAYFAEHPVHAFVHASKAEGVPVSLMIAASFGVPIIAHDAMGIVELVDNDHGCLLPDDASVGEFAEAIREITDKQTYDVNFRGAIRKHWRKNFSLENYHTLHRDKMRVR